MPHRNQLRQQLLSGLDALKLALPAIIVEQLLDYVALLLQWNTAYNLTAVRQPDEIISRHLLDSLAVAPYIVGKTLADLGSGAGLPGIPLALAAPNRLVSLVDSNGKKARFLREVVRSLQLNNVSILQHRVEDVEGLFDCITARAFTSLAQMLTWGGHLLAPNGTWLALKGQYPDNELADIPTGFHIEAIHPLTIPGLDAERHVVVIKKTLGDSH